MFHLKHGTLRIVQPWKTYLKKCLQWVVSLGIPFTPKPKPLKPTFYERKTGICVPEACGQFLSMPPRVADKGPVELRGEAC